MTPSKHIRFFLSLIFTGIAFICFVSSANATSAPVVAPYGTHVYNQIQTVSMFADTGAQIYYTLDGTTPTSSSTLYTGAFSPTYSVCVKAIALLSGVYSTVTTSNVVLDYNAGPVLSTNPVCWVRSDFGVTSSSGAVSQWLDVTGNSNSFTQSTSANQPTLVTNAINGLPAISFNGSSQCLQFPSEYIYFNPGINIFVVTKPATSSGNYQFLSFGNGAASNSFGLGTTSGDLYFYSYAGTSSSAVTNTTAVLPQFQLSEIAYDSVNTGTLFNNGVQTAQSTSLHPNPNITITHGYMGQFTGGGSYFNGQIAEVLIYSTLLTSSARIGIEGYLMQKYQFSQQVPAAPIISVPTSTLSAPSYVAIASEDGAPIYYTTDGTTPTTSSPLYSGPINIYFTQTLKAISAANGYTSSVSSATYTLNSTQWPAPNASDPTPLQIQLQTPTNSVPQ